MLNVKCPVSGPVKDMNITVSVYLVHLHCTTQRAHVMFLDSRPLIVIYGRRLDRIEPKATAASSIIGQ